MWRCQSSVQVRCLSRFPWSMEYPVQSKLSVSRPMALLTCHFITRLGLLCTLTHSGLTTPHCCSSLQTPCPCSWNTCLSSKHTPASLWNQPCPSLNNPALFYVWETAIVRESDHLGIHGFRRLHICLLLFYSLLETISILQVPFIIAGIHPSALSLL